MTPEPITALHVDDDSSLCDLVKECLEREDPKLTIIPESSAEAGMERLESDTIDCVVSDYDMPDIDGLEFLKAVRAKYGDLPFILYTGKGSEEIAEQAINAGVDAYYQKETGTGQYTVLAKQITTLVEKHTAEQRLDYIIREKHIADGGVYLENEPETVGEKDSISMAIVNKVAAREGIDPVALTPPLNESINPEALDALFSLEPGNSKSGADSVTFTYLGYTITISGHCQVTIDE